MSNLTQAYLDARQEILASVEVKYGIPTAQLLDSCLNQLSINAAQALFAPEDLTTAAHQTLAAAIYNSLHALHPQAPDTELRDLATLFVNLAKRAPQGVLIVRLSPYESQP